MSNWNAPWMQGQSSNQLGAVIGKGRRVEYRVENTIFKLMGMDRGTGAFCVPDAEVLQEILYRVITNPELNTPMSQHYNPVLVKDAATVYQQMNEDLDKVKRKRGTSERTPGCILRKDATTQNSKYIARSFATHERFHADVREIEAASGLKINDPCVGNEILDLLQNRYGRTALPVVAAGHVLGWAADNSDMLGEEVLARVEEVRKACMTKDRRGCSEANLLWYNQFDLINQVIAKQGRSERVDPQGLWKLAEAVQKKDGGAFQLAQTAVRKCAGPAFKLRRMGRKKKAARAINRARKAAREAAEAAKAPKLKSMIEFD